MFYFIFDLVFDTGEEILQLGLYYVADFWFGYREGLGCCVVVFGHLLGSLNQIKYFQDYFRHNCGLKLLVFI